MSYIERTNTVPGVELVGRWNSRSFGYLGITVSGSWGTSSAISTPGVGPDLTVDRDFSTLGFDLWWGAPVLSRGPWNASLAIGPTFQWQNLEIAGHPDELADPGSPNPPSVDWTDRTWLAPGATFVADLGYDFGLRSGVFAGFSFRLLSTGGTSTWATQDEDAILDATGQVVRVNYDSGLAASVAFRTGLRWYP